MVSTVTSDRVERNPVRRSRVPGGGGGHRRAVTGCLRAVRRALKWVGNSLGLVFALAPAASCWLKWRFSNRDDLFLFWGQLFALAPGLPGKYLRKGYYRLTLKACAPDCELHFLSYFTDHEAEVGRRVYVGPGASIGTASLGDGCLIGSRCIVAAASVVSSPVPDGCIVGGNPARFVGKSMAS